MFDEAIASGSLVPPAAGTTMDLESYFQSPEEWRAGFAMLRGQGFTPPVIGLLKEAEELEASLANCNDAAERIRLRRSVSELRARFQMALERLRGG